MNFLRKSVPQVTLKENEEYNTFVYYNFIENLWIDKVSVYNNSLVTNSNHFIKLNSPIQETGLDSGIPRKPHYIFSRITNMFNTIQHCKKFLKPIEIEEKCIFLHNSFSAGNAGHELFVILNVLNKHKGDKSIKFVLFEEINNNNSQIINLFIKPERIIKIKSDTFYNFKRQLFENEIGCHKAIMYKDIINEIKEKIKENIQDENLKNKKVIIIKNTKNKKVVRKQDCFDADVLFDYLKEKGWYICDVENDNLKKMAYILMNASVIVSGQRGISCFNQIFYNIENCKFFGFIVGGNKIKITDNTEIIKDDFCNGLYFHLIEKIIHSPLKINKEHAKEFEKIINLEIKDE